MVSQPATTSRRNNPSPIIRAVAWASWKGSVSTASIRQTSDFPSLYGQIPYRLTAPK